MNVKPLFKLMVEKKASDLFFAPFAPAKIKIDGKIMPVNKLEMTPKMVKQAALELMQQAGEYGLTPDQVLIGCSGGGLASGSALAIRALSPGTEVLCVEPEGFDDTRRSLEAGRRLANAPGVCSICDALMSPSPGVLNFALMRELLAGGVAVSDAEVLDAMAWGFRHLRLVIEPGGAVALAAVLAGKLPLAGRTTAIVLTGGNVDAATFAEAIAR
jgi:threonine dehydratase